MCVSKSFNSTALPHVVKHKMCVCVCVCVCVSKLVQQQHVVAQQVLGHHRLFEVIIRIQNVLEAKIVLD